MWYQAIVNNDTVSALVNFLVTDNANLSACLQPVPGAPPLTGQTGVQMLVDALDPKAYAAGKDLGYFGGQ